QSVLVARRYVMLAYDVRADLLARASALTPGIESPTISPLHREGWVAVQAMVLRAEVHRVMDELYEAGARAILGTDGHACRLKWQTRVHEQCRQSPQHRQLSSTPAPQGVLGIRGRGRDRLYRGLVRPARFAGRRQPWGVPARRPVGHDRSRGAGRRR